MNRMLRLQDGLLSVLAILGAMAIFALLAHVSLDVLMRNLSGTPIPATYEIVTHYYMVAMAFVPLAWLEKSGGMIQVEVINGWLSPGMLRLSDLLIAVLSTAVYAVLTYVTFKVASSNTANGAFLLVNNTRIVTWPAYWLPPLGFALAGLATTIRFISLLGRSS